MVKIKFATGSGAIHFKAIGHAQYAEYGYDIVCASVSILAYSLAEAVNEAKKCEYLSHPPSISISEGRIEVECLPISEEYDRMLTIFNTIKMGYRLLASNYPENIILDESGFTHSK